MAIQPIDIVSVAASQDYSIIKHNEDHRSVLQQSAMLEQGEKGKQQKQSEVVAHEKAEWHDKGFDPREKGNNEYYRDPEERKRREKQQKKEKQEQVIVNGHTGFDIKI